MSAHQMIKSSGVHLSSDDAVQIGRLLQLLAPSDNTVSGLLKSVRRQDEGSRLPRAVDSRSLMGLARNIYARRRSRSRHFPAAFFGEPAWDMLLALYATGEDSRRQSVSNLIDLASCPPTTALRYLASLEQEALVERTAHPNDGRVFFVSLSAKGREAIETYLSSILEI